MAPCKHKAEGSTFTRESGTFAAFSPIHYNKTPPFISFVTSQKISICPIFQASLMSAGTLPSHDVEHGAFIMDLKVISAGGQGDQKSEYVVLQAKKDCNLNSYMIFDETYKDDGSASNKHRNVFIFPDVKPSQDTKIITLSCHSKHLRAT